MKPKKKNKRTTKSSSKTSASTSSAKVTPSGVVPKPGTASAASPRTSANFTSDPFPFHGIDPSEVPELASDVEARGSTPDVESWNAPTPSSPDASGDIEGTLRELESDIDDFAKSTASSTRNGPPFDSSWDAPPASTRRPSLAPESDHSLLGTARELLSSDFYMRKWGRLGMRNRSEEVDDFGLDPVYEQRVLPALDFLYSKYFRVEAEGVANIPTGRCLLVANHSGTVPYDGLMMKVAVKRHHPAHRDVRWLAEDSIFHLPFVGSFSNRLGAVRACQENAERLLDRDSLVAVFPEGVKGIGKLYKDRYRLQRFGRGGFVRLCLRTHTPIVPVAIIGAEETNPMLARVDALNKVLGIPYFPITPTFPLLGPAGLLPAPTKWKILFGKPITLDGHGPESARDEILVNRLADDVRGAIQSMVDTAIAHRRSVWFG